MAHPLRIEGAFYHVTSRGNRKETNEIDRKIFLSVLDNVVQKPGWVCHAYRLMGNHLHLAIETPEANLSAGMRRLNGIHSQAINRPHEQVGVFGDRSNGRMLPLGT